MSAFNSYIFNNHNMAKVKNLYLLSSSGPHSFVSLIDCFGVNLGCSNHCNCSDNLRNLYRITTKDLIKN